MALLTKQKFEELAKQSGQFCISLYIPTERSGDNKKNKLRLKNQISNVELQLLKLGVNAKEIDSYLEPLHHLLKDSGLWRHLSDALIIFRNQNDFSYTTLPIETEDFNLVSDRYYLLPLLSMFNQTNTFFILALSQNQNRLYKANQNEIREIPTEDLFPQNLNESVGYDVEQKSLQFRSGQTNSGHGLYHGKGEGKDDKGKELKKYLKHIDKGLNQIIEGYSSPVVIAAVDTIFSMFKTLSNYKNIYPEAVLGNYDNSDILLVHEKACEILQPWFEADRKENKQKFQEYQDKTLTEISDVIPAAYMGSVETLFVEKNRFVWGKSEPNLDKLQVHKKKQALDNCLLDMAARLTFLKGGKVFREEPDNLPEPKAVANAVLRY
jgi:hypothetical protein